MPAISQPEGDKGLKALSSQWDTQHVYTTYVRAGPRNRKDNYGGAPGKPDSHFFIYSHVCNHTGRSITKSFIILSGYYSEGFLFLQRKIDYILLEFIYSKERVAKLAGLIVPSRYAIIDKVHPLLQRFPYPPYKNSNLVHLLTQQLALILLLCYMPLFIINIWLLVKERQAGAKVS